MFQNRPGTVTFWTLYISRWHIIYPYLLHLDTHEPVPIFISANSRHLRAPLKMPFSRPSDENTSHRKRLINQMNTIPARTSAYPVATAPFQGGFRPSSRHLGRRTPEEIFHSPHVVDQIHQTNLGCGSHLAFDPYPEPPTCEHVLVAKDMLHPGTNPGTGTIGSLLLLVHLPVSVPFVGHLEKFEVPARDKEVPPFSITQGIENVANRKPRFRFAQRKIAWMAIFRDPLW